MIVILGDTHFGARSSNRQYHENFAKFYSDFFRFVDLHQIKTIIQTGDLFDVRKHVDTWSLSFFKSVFLNECIKRDLNVYVIVGNHDMHMKESLEINTPRLILEEYSTNFTVVDSPTEYLIEGNNYLLVPWICKQNSMSVLTAINNSDADYMVGHFEFVGFPMHKNGSLCSTGLDPSALTKFKKIISGHYHTQSEKGNVLYTGTPYELTWIDADDPKGFWTIAGGDISFVRNPHILHQYIKYPSLDVDICDKFVRATIDGEPDKKDLQKWKDKLVKMNPYDIKYIENHTSLYTDTVDIKQIASTEELIFKFIDDSVIEVDKTRLKQTMHEIYVKAKELK